MKKITKIAIVIAVVIILAFIFGNSILTKRQSNGLSKGIYDTLSPYLSKVYARFLRSFCCSETFGVNRMVTCSTGLFSATEYNFCV